MSFQDARPSLRDGGRWAVVRVDRLETLERLSSQRVRLSDTQTAPCAAGAGGMWAAAVLICCRGPPTKQSAARSGTRRTSPDVVGAPGAQHHIMQCDEAQAREQP